MGSDDGPRQHLSSRFRTCPRAVHSHSHVGGITIVALRPTNVRDVVMDSHYEISTAAAGRVIARTLP